MAGFWDGATRRGVHELEVRDADLANRSGRALVSADESIRAAVDEFGFAEAGISADATRQLIEALAAGRGELGDAFRLNRLDRAHHLTRSVGT